MVHNRLILAACVALGTQACNNNSQPETAEQPQTDSTEFIWQTEQFADKKIIRYQVPGFDKLSPQQCLLVYYLTEAGLSGRDIIWHQNYRHNLAIRHALEKIMQADGVERTGANWDAFVVYTKQVWFSNGIHHHYSMEKHKPGFDRGWFEQALTTAGASLSEEALKAIFDPAFDAKKVSLDPTQDLLEASAVNFYAPEVSQKEAEAYYASIIDKQDETPVEYGLNTRLVKNEAGKVTADTFKVGGLYSPAIERIVYWLDKAAGVAENEPQEKALRLLIEYYQTGDLAKWDEYNIAWTAATEGDIDYINGFVEVYNDPLGYKGSYESIVQINDFEASDRMKVVAENAQWFEDHAPIDSIHRKENVVGISYKVVNVAGEAGDASPSTPIGVNLPNSNWVRAEHGSKSVSLGNIVEAYDRSSGEGLLSEFAHDEEEIELAKKYGSLAGKMHTALHEVLGHASGKLEPGVGTPKETLKNYYSTIEEGRADLVALYFIMDEKLVELGLIENLDVAKAEYDGYIRNGLLTQLRRLELGSNIEESHMRNRAWVSAWVVEKGIPAGAIERVEREGKIYYNILDYGKMRALFGDLLREVQRIKSKGDYQAAYNLVENYGVKVDQAVHQQVLDRSSKLNIAPYGGFINPQISLLEGENGEATDAEIAYPADFTEQMLHYGKTYSFLPVE